MELTRVEICSSEKESWVKRRINDVFPVAISPTRTAFPVNCSLFASSAIRIIFIFLIGFIYMLRNNK